MNHWNPTDAEGPGEGPADRNRYTVDGNPEAERRVASDQELISRRVVETIPGKHFEALVLMGGYGRGEGGYVIRDGSVGPYNDYDYFVVFRGLDRARVRAMKDVVEPLAHELTEQVGVEVDLALLRAESLRVSQFNLMNAEMLWGHRVVAGNPDVLSVMPPMPIEALAMGEFTRLMNNRGSLLLMNALRLYSGDRLSKSEHEAFFKYLFKAILACGDALLAMAGIYDPAYLRKRELLKGLQSVDEAFMELYGTALEQKFHPEPQRFLKESPAAWQERVTQTWLRTFYELESQRTGGGVGDWTQYASPGLAKGQLESSGFLRNAAITLRDFGAVQALRYPAWTFRYPRERMISVLPLLLSNAPVVPDPVRVPLDLDENADWSAAVNAYLEAWPRYA